MFSMRNKKYYPQILPHIWSSAKFSNNCTVKILNIGTCMSVQTVYILIRLLLKSSLIRIYTVCNSVYIFWRNYFIVKLNCFILRTTMVVSLGVPIFRVFTVSIISSSVTGCLYFYNFSDNSLTAKYTCRECHHAQKSCL